MSRLGNLGAPALPRRGRLRLRRQPQALVRDLDPDHHRGHPRPGGARPELRHRVPGRRRLHHARDASTPSARPRTRRPTASAPPTRSCRSSASGTLADPDQPSSTPTKCRRGPDTTLATGPEASTPSEHRRRSSSVRAGATRSPSKALQGLVVFLVLVVIYLAIAFEWRMAVAALVALLHDLVITVGIYSLVGFEVTPATVIGFLTILGYSLYDTVVVFDKVSENTDGPRRADPDRPTARPPTSRSTRPWCARSTPRSSRCCRSAAMLFVGVGLLGAGTLKDLALALFVGIAAGAYSSIFIATPLLADLKEREPADTRRCAKRVARQAAPAPRANGRGAGAGSRSATEPDDRRRRRPSRQRRRRGGGGRRPARSRPRGRRARRPAGGRPAAKRR